MKIDNRLIFKIILVLILVISGFLLFLFSDKFSFISQLSNKELLKANLESYGLLTPFIYMGIQILQVLIAPIPGEITGIVGGYIFGPWLGFLYSTIALTAGSFINFIAARYAGRDAIRKLIPNKYFTKFDKFFDEEGKIFILALFIFPGFPKDYFCVFLGITNIDLRLFIIFACVGRMPGTILLSLQGALMYEGAYSMTVFLAVITSLLSFLMVFFRKKIYLLFKKKA